MFYLADFKRRYEKELFVTDEKGKPKYNYFRGGHQTKSSSYKNFIQGNKDKVQSRITKLGTARSSVINARKLEKEYGKTNQNKNILGRYKYSEGELEDRKKRLRINTGGFNDGKQIAPTLRQKKLAKKIEKNNKRLAEIKKQKDIKEITSDLWEEVKVEKIPKTKTKKVKIQKLLKASDRPPVNLPNRNSVKLTNDNPRIKLPTEDKIVNPKKISRKLGRKVLLGLGSISVIGGIGYGINKLRKTRSDKGKIRGKYKK